jgi:predicted dithiol-disulfide oxidoreductase (DUF899 family)
MRRQWESSSMRQTNLTNESSEYVAKREELRLAEIESMRQLERVAELRRRLPEGAVVEDYEFLEGPADLGAGDEPVKTVRLSELFTEPGRALVIYQLMFGKKQTTPCPMCTMWIDGYNGVAHHLTKNMDFAIAAALSCGSSTFKRDMASEDTEGNQDSTISAFTRDASGTLRHFYSAHPWLGEDVNERGIDRLTPVYNMLISFTVRGSSVLSKCISRLRTAGERMRATKTRRRRSRRTVVRSRR